MKNDDFFKRYRGRYSRYWIERFGMIPELPTSFDNANSIYELIAWLQRAFKQLLDDFLALESEFQKLKESLKEFLEYIIPEVIKRYAKSKEFREVFSKLLKELLENDDKEWFKNFLKGLFDDELKEWFKDYLKKLFKEDDFKEYFKEFIKGLLNEDSDFLKDIQDILGITDLKEKLEQLKNQLEDLKNDLNSKIADLNSRLDEANRKNAELESTLSKIIANLEGSGAWSGGLKGGFVGGRNIATGNINIFGGTPDGSSFIRTNNGSTENDLAGGI